MGVERERRGGEEDRQKGEKRGRSCCWRTLGLDLLDVPGRGGGRGEG